MKRLTAGDLLNRTLSNIHLIAIRLKHSFRANWCKALLAK